MVYGVKALGTYSLGYFSREIGPPVPPPLMPHSTRSTHGVVAPHASFLALRYAPHEAVFGNPENCSTFFQGTPLLLYY